MQGQIEVPAIEITGTVEIGRSEEAAYAETNERIIDLEERAIILNGEFDDTAGFWPQVQGEDKREDSVIIHGREITENFGNLEVSPAIVTQTKVRYSDDYSNDQNNDHQFARMTNGYHELIVDGTVSNIPSDNDTPNFSALGATAYNKAKGGTGVCAVIGRVDDVGYDDTALGRSSGIVASKSCAAAFQATRRAAYRQGYNVNQPNAKCSYTIGLETYVRNNPTYPNTTSESGYNQDNDFYGNDDFFRFRSWSCGYHCVNGGTRPVTAGIYMSGFSGSTLTSGAYNGIVIGKSLMRINGTNSTETVGINMGSWSKNDFYGYKAIRIGYAPRTLSVRGSALMESPSFKFMNPNGDMPVVISAGNVLDGNGNIVRGYTPYLLFKTGADNSERPDDIGRAKIGYNTASQYLNTVSDKDIRFVVNGTFSSTANPSQDADADPTIPTNTETDSIIYKFQGSNFISSVTASTAANPQFADLGGANYFWGNAFIRTGAINIADSDKFKANPVVVESGEATDEKTKILTAWGNIRCKLFEFKNSSKKHIGLIAQDIESAFAAQNLNAEDYGLFWKNTDSSGNTTYGLRYNECLALECAYLRSQLTGV